MATASEAPEQPQPGKKRKRRWWVWLLPIVAIPVLVVIYVAATMKPYRIPSEAMEPTIKVDDRILVRRGGDVEVGDLAVVHPPTGAIGETPQQCGEQVAENELCPRSTGEQADVTFVKRVVGRGGDRIALRDGKVVRNGRPVDEPYVAPCTGGFACDYPKAITVPEGQLYVLGDNRGASDDSRFWGPVDEDWVVGPVAARYWPPSRWGSPD